MTTLEKTNSILPQYDNILFLIEDLVRKFGAKTALRIPKLTIPRGKLIALVGISGCGKTTLLETLALLSQKKSGDIGDVTYYPENNEHSKQYSQLWVNEQELETVRRQDFGFVFQHFNLLPDYSVLNNIAVSAVLNGSTYSESIRKAYKSLASVFDRIQVADIKDKKPKYLAGGQQQRVAFLRSIVKRDWKVLFADEPTGNLGESDADLIFEEIDKQIHPEKYSDTTCADGESKTVRTAIIVTHNLHLPIKYADRIIVIGTEGEIFSDQSVWIRKDKNTWYHEDSGTVTEFRQNDMHAKLNNEITKIPTQSSPQMKVSEVPLESDDHNKLSFLARFRKRDGFKELINKHKDKEFRILSNSYLFILLALFATFLAIGIGIAGFKVIRTELDSSFAKMVNITFTARNIEYIENVVESLNREDVRTKYGISKSFPYRIFWMQFYNFKADSNELVRCRTMEFDDELFKEISTQYLIHGTSFRGDQDMGVIISEELANRLFQSDDPTYVFKVSLTDTSKDGLFAIPIRGIATQMPSNVDVMTTRYFLDQYSNGVLNPIDSTLRLFGQGGDIEAEKACKDLEMYFNRDTVFYNSYRPEDPSPEVCMENWKKGYLIRVNFANDKNLDYKAISRIYRELQNDENIQSDSLIKLNALRVKLVTDEQFVKERPTQIATYIHNLRNIRNLKKYLQDNSNFDYPDKIGVDLSEVRSKEILNIISRLGIVSSIVLAIIVAGLLAMYLTSTIMSILHRNRVYIGILLGMGTSKILLCDMYLSRANQLLSQGLAVAYFAAWLIGEQIINRFRPFELRYSNNILVNLIFGSILMGIVWIAVKDTTRQYFAHDPGELIYDRIEESKNWIEKFIEKYWRPRV